MLLPYYQSDVIEAGCDEAGRGCLAGPVVAASVILPSDFRCDELNDSKQLTEKQRDMLRIIIEREALAWGVAAVSAQEIDKINILKASILAMHKALDKLKLRPEHIIVDGNRFYPYNAVPHHTIVKGDGKYLSIAAASVLAKTHRDALMVRLSKNYPQYGWEKSKGYPTKYHRDALQKYGATPWHRNSFHLKEAVQLKLDLDIE